MRPIILISSCNRDRRNGHNQAVRDCWAHFSPIPYKFFLGDLEPERDDEVGLPWCPDNYFSLTQKTQESLRWALDQGYDWFFRAFTDTFIDTVRLASFAQEIPHITCDYIGNTSFSPRILFCHGGPGYWLSRRAAELVVQAPRQGEFEKMEDQFVGEVMMKHSIKPIVETRFSMGQSYGMCEPAVLPHNDIITCHLSNWCNKYVNEWMYQAYFWRYRQHAPLLDVHS